MKPDDQVNELIEKSLQAARSLIEEGGTWGSLAHIIHPGGVQTLIAKGLHSDKGERARDNANINLLMHVLKGNLLVTISDAWIGEETPGGCEVSFDSAFSGRRKALVVEIWGCSQRLVSGMQEYKHVADGQVHFGELRWSDSAGPRGF